MTQLKVRSESWPFVGTFTISRGSRTTSEVVVVELHRDGICGLGECVPYPRYDESVDSVLAQLQELAPALADGLERDGLAEVFGCMEVPGVHYHSYNKAARAKRKVGHITMVAKDLESFEQNKNALLQKIR